MRRDICKKTTLQESGDDNFVPGTPEELFQMVWEMTQDLYHFMGKGQDAEQRLQRDAINIIRPRR